MAGNNEKTISKPEILSSLNKLGNLQTASLYSINQDFVKDNTKFVNSVVNIVQNAVALGDNSIATSTPKMLVDTIQQSFAAKKSQSAKNAATQGTVDYITGIKGLTDTSPDMDLFRQLFPLATPMFELFYEYQMIYEMIPEASKCFDILKNAVLSADNFSKEYLIPRYDNFRIDTDTLGISSSEQEIVKLIDETVKEYDLNTLFDKYITEAMKLGAKPVMIIPIDSRFRKTAERVLRTESADDMRSLLNEQFSDGTAVKMEDALQGYVEVKTESGDFETTGLEDPNTFTSVFDDTIDKLIDEYEVEFEDNISLVKVSDLTTEEKKEFDNMVKDRKAQIKRVKNKKNRKKVAMEMAKAIDKMVNGHVKFTYTTDALTMKDTAKIASQIKTMRKVKQRLKNRTDNNGVAMEDATMESIYGSDDTALERDIEHVCELMSAQKKVQVVHDNGKGKTTVSYEDAHPTLSMTFEDENSDDYKEHVTGSVIIPLQPDTVIPISVHGEHIGYYVVERTGSDDLGSGVADLLGYRTSAGSNGLGVGVMNLYGANTSMSGAEGAGVIIRDMIDIPASAGGGDIRRWELLRGMIVRAVSERLNNPDIIDDKAFNSLIFSLIKDDYITKRDVKISYVPMESMVYFAHEINPNNGIGVSIMQNGLFFAHVYIAALVTNLMIAIAKSADREQINVEVGVGDRLEAMVQRIMRSAQAKRASIDSIGNVDTIMRSLGTFQKFISPRKNGNPLIELETIPGQQVDFDNSLMEKALKSFINSMHVPHSALNYLDDAEYARSLALQNAMFMTKVVNMQSQYQLNCAKFERIILRNKFPERILNKENAANVNKATNKHDKTVSAGVATAQDLIDLNKVFLDLPSPEGLNITSLNDQISAVSSFSDSVTDLIAPLDIAMNPDLSDKLENIKNRIKLGMFRKYLPGLPWDDFDTMVETAKSEVDQAQLKADKPDDDMGASSGGGGGGSSSSDSGSDDDSGGDDDNGGFGDFNF